MSSPWNPNTFRRSDVALFARQDVVYGKLPPVCRECLDIDQSARTRPWTHVVIANSGYTRHYTRLVKDLDRGGNGATFCRRLFSFKVAPRSEGRGG